MKKIISLIISIIMLTGLCACTNTQTQTQTQTQKQIEAALDTFFDMEADYADIHFPVSFTQEEVETCMKQPEYADTIDAIEQKLCVADIGDPMDRTQAINYAISFDYVYRPAFLGDRAEFARRFNMLVKEYDTWFMSKDSQTAYYSSYHMPLTSQYYLQHLRADKITNETVDCATLVIDEVCPKLPVADPNNLFIYNKWGWCQWTVAFLEKAVGIEDRFEYYSEVNSTWWQDAAEKGRADSGD